MKLLFVHNHLSSFVRQDLECLRQLYEVTEFPVLSRVVNPLKVWRAVQQHDLVFGWFASWHMVLPLLCARCLGKPSVLVTGGYDLANLPEISYGHQRGGVRKHISRACLRMAGTLLTNSRFSEQEAARTGCVRSIHVAYHGVPDVFGKLPPGPRERLAVTIGNVDQVNCRRKGLEPFVRAAALLPGVKFAVIGNWKDDAISHLRAIATPNVEFTGWIGADAVRDYLERASVYVQASRHEGFGMAVAEAMLAGCIPVITSSGALPEVVAECGVYASSAEPAALAQAIEQGLEQPESRRAEARQHILTHFPMDQRRRALHGVVSSVSSWRGPHAVPSASRT